jgi:hypothetical protein
MKNRVDKLLKEKQKALSNIRFAKNRSHFLTKVNKSKEHENNYKQSYRDMMQEKLREQKDEIERKRLEMRANIITSKKNKIEENRMKKEHENNVKVIKKLEFQQYMNQEKGRHDISKESVINHRKQKSQKFETLNNVKSDVNQIRYHMKNEKLGSTRDEQAQEIERLRLKEQELLMGFKHILDRQDKIESETNSPKKFRRAPSLNVDAKLSMFQNGSKNKEMGNKKMNTTVDSIFEVGDKESYDRDNQATPVKPMDLSEK